MATVYGHGRGDPEHDGTVALSGVDTDNDVMRVTVSRTQDAV